MFGNNFDMKMLLCFGLIALLILPLYNVQNQNLFEIEGISEIYFVENIDGKQEYVLKNKDNLGNSEVNKAEGIIIVFDEECDVVLNSLDADIIKRERVEEIEILYCYTPLFSDFIFLEGKQVNVQIIERQNQIVAGFPLILSGF